MLLEENHELLLKLHIVDDKIIVIGDPQYFPKLAETKGQMELCEWLDKTDDDTAGYFQALSSLYAALVYGRNLKVSPTLQRVLPYDLVLRVITDERLNKEQLDVNNKELDVSRHLDVARQCAAAGCPVRPHRPPSPPRPSIVAPMARLPPLCHRPVTALLAHIGSLRTRLGLRSQVRAHRDRPLREQRHLREWRVCRGAPADGRRGDREGVAFGAQGVRRVHLALALRPRPEVEPRLVALRRAQGVRGQ